MKNNIKFETLRKNHKKKVIIGVVVICIVGSVLVFKTTRAKYRFTQSIPFVRGTINYKPYDFKMMAMYQQKAGSECTEDSCYNEISIMPASGYTINESKSYCTKDGTNKDTNAVLKTIDGNHTIAQLSKNEKCYLYFDKHVSANGYILLGKTKSTENTFNPAFTEETTNKLYIAEDEDGISYYYAGAATDNYLKFAGFYWRIIRINGNGSIRLIYDGTTARDNGTSSTDTQIGKSVFNSYTSLNQGYSGYMYTLEDMHGVGISSDIKNVLDAWYKTNIVDKGYGGKLDINVGFCGDRSGMTEPGESNYFYGAYIRLGTGQRKPTLKCLYSEDLYTVSGASKGNKALSKPIGLISADEVAFAGGMLTNTNYYLYTGQNYWTMSPSYYYIRNYAGVVNVSNRIDFFTSSANSLGVRPVINLNSSVVKLTGNGTKTDPYVVQ